MKVIRALKNRNILIKGTNRKTISQKGGFLNFFGPLMTVWFRINEKYPHLPLNIFKMQ